MPKYLIRHREHKIGRSLLGDFMDDDLNEQLYGLLLDASNKIEEACELLAQQCQTPGDGGRSEFQAGVLRAAQGILEDEIDEEYTPLREVHHARSEKVMLQALHARLNGRNKPG